MMQTNASPSLSTRIARAFEAYRTGDHSQMDVLVDEATPILWHTARAQGAGESSAQDAVQTAFLRLVDKSDTIRDPQAVLGWLLVTVRREAWRLGRVDLSRVDGVDEDTPSTAPSIPEATIRREEQRVLWRHVARLSDRCQALLRIIAFADRPDYEAVSQALGMPVGSIGPTRGRCLAKLRLLLENDPAWEGAS